jgi:AraC-like DNA-binding protein
MLAPDLIGGGNRFSEKDMHKRKTPETGLSPAAFATMETTSRHILASGPGWSVSDVVCSAGPHDRPFEERHSASCIAIVTAGTFQYRSSDGAALLNPGAVLLGNAGSAFECGHEHAVGDRCLSFRIEADFLEQVVAAVPGARETAFTVPRLPPSWCFVPLLAQAEAAREDRDAAAFEELTLRLTGAVSALLGANGKARPARPPARDARRITAALRRIEAYADQHIALSELARQAAMSPYHFLRTFRHVVGMTPHQFVLRTRLTRAAIRIRRSDDAIATIAFASGFNDLSTFNRRFRQIMGASPSTYRASV